ncbi:hypothetical protein [Dactylosporangium salmoneum]|uniref:Uncharacterized protein n=1 Tax=Dactylosporangium salmoneum TaxID=53361 RepID=A0ABP5SA31_9ACTN
MSNKIRSTHVICVLAGAGIGVAAGGLLGVDVDLSGPEAVSILVSVLVVSLGTLVSGYYLRQVKAYLDQVRELRAADRREGYVEGYLEAVSDRM